MKTPEYWAKRFNQLEQSQHDRGAEAFSEIDRKYRRAEREIERKIAAWYQRFADNNGITLQEAQKWLTEKELEEFKWDVQEYIRYGQENAVDGAWEKQLENASARYHINRLESLKVQCQQDIEVLFGSQKDIFDQLLSDVYRFAYYHTAFEIHKGVGVGWDFAALDRKTIGKVINKPWAVDGKNFSDRIWSDKQKLLSELDTTLTQNIILGQDPQKAINAISKKMNVSKANAGRLVMTEEAYFSSEGQKDCFKELDVEQYEIVATLDSRTSEICRNMDGKVFKMSEWKVGVTAPPFHPWCRTTTVPHFDDEFDVGERAARSADGQTYYVPGNMTYKEWKQSLERNGKLENIGLQNQQEAERQYAERQEEKYTRLAKNSLDEGNKKTHEKNVVEWRKQQSVSNLTVDEEGAIIRYVSPDAYVLNDKLRRGATSELTDIEKEWIKNLDSALRNLPNYEGDLNRSVTFWFAEDAQKFFDGFVEGKEYTPKQYLSTTKGGVYNDDAQVQIYIQNAKNGKDLGKLNDMENEVLYPFMSRFKVINKVQQDRKFYILLEELE